MKKIKRNLILPLLLIGEMYMSNMAFSSTSNATPHWNASLYKQHAVRLQLTSALELLKCLSIDPKARILDLGCGEGKVTDEVSKRVPEGFVEAVDLSSEMIALAQRDFAAIKNVNFQQMNAEKLNFTEPFDWVVSFFCLQWVPDKDQAFKELTRVLKKGGKVALIMTNRNPHLLKIRSKLIQGDKWKKYFENYEDSTNAIDDDRYQFYAERAGLSAISYTENDKTIVFDTKDELKAFIKMVTPAIKMLPVEHQEAFITELTDAYLMEIPTLENSKFYITYTLKTLLATK